MQRYLITPSLHDAWRFFHIMEEKTKQDFLDTLLKIRKDPTPAMLAGIDFENHVAGMASGHLALPDSEYRNCVSEVAAQVSGSLSQERVMSDVTVRGAPFLLYGRADFVKRNWIYDLKFTANYEVGKYRNSIQHLVYMWCSQIPNFRYLISDGKTVWSEDYHLGDDSYGVLCGELEDLIGGIYSDDDFKTAYQNNWQTLGK